MVVSMVLRMVVVLLLIIAVTSVGSAPDTSKSYILFLAVLSSAEHLDEVPLIGNISQVRYLLWTRDNPDTDEYFRLNPFDAKNLVDSPFVPERRTFFMFHGYNGNGFDGWCLHSKDYLLPQYNANVISVDWSKLDPAPMYLNAVANVYKVANLTASLIDWLANETSFSPSQVHIIGHSLGAQAAGLTGKYVQAGSVGRVTGMDPAGPAFYNKTSDHRIDSSDADFVDIYHTNGCVIEMGCIGLFQKVGHMDFYVNGGVHQPGCEENVNWINDIEDAISLCSHRRVTALWVESLTAIRPDPVFASRPCNSIEDYDAGLCEDCGTEGCVDMGLHVHFTESIAPIYVLETRDSKPYAVGDP